MTQKKTADEDSPVLLVKSRINENLLRKILDLIPGMVEFSLYSAGYSNKKCLLLNLIEHQTSTHTHIHRTFKLEIILFNLFKF